MTLRRFSGTNADRENGPGVLREVIRHRGFCYWSAFGGRRRGRMSVEPDEVGDWRTMTNSITANEGRNGDKKQENKEHLG